MQNNTPFVYTEDQLMARLKFFIGVCLALTLTGIVFVVLYSIIFVTQPLNAMSPIDQKFFELIVPIATFLTGTLSGIMLAGRPKEEQEAMLQSTVSDDGISSKRVVTFLAFIFCSIAFFANLFFQYKIDTHLFDGMMYIAIAGLGVTVAERFAPKAPLPPQPLLK